ncbi:MAG TPA: trypsin-like peptidase domain-containing protein [Anaerolineae bacterium]
MELMQDLDTDLAALAEKVRRSLVEVHNGRRGQGAGTVWQSRGLVLTNAHVIGQGQIAVALPDGRDLPARVLARDDRRDLAALAIDAGDLPPIELGDSRALRPGQWVMAIGHPWGVPGAATAGIIIGSGSPLSEGPLPGPEAIIAGLHLRPGHSGGPLVDSMGRLVGINVMMHGPDVGVAIPVNVAKRFLREALGA